MAEQDGRRRGGTGGRVDRSIGRSVGMPNAGARLVCCHLNVKVDAVEDGALVDDEDLDLFENPRQLTHALGHLHVHGMCMACAWCAHGVRMACAWRVHGK